MKSAQVQSGAIQWDGKIPFVVKDVAVDLINSNQVNQIVAPCDAQLVALICNLLAAPGSAAATLEIGTATGSPSGLDKDGLVSHSFATTDSTGLYDLVSEIGEGALGVNVAKGDVITFGSDGGATSTGTVAVTAVFMPR